jgi:hypothetical protein
MVKGNGNNKKSKNYTARKKLEQYIDEEFAILKQQFSAALQQMSEQIGTYSEDIGIAKSLSILTSRIVFDLAAGKEIKLMETEYGKTVDRAYYLRQLQTIEDVDAFVTGRTVSEEEMEQLERDKKENHLKQKLDAWISKSVKLNGETGLRKASSDDKLLEFVKAQRVGMDWEDDMGQFVSEVYDKNMDRLVTHRKKLLEKIVKGLLFENGIGFKHNDEFNGKIESSFKKRTMQEEFLWRDEILDWIPAVVDEVEEKFDRDGKELVEKVKELVSKWGEDYSADVEEIAQHVDNKEYMQMMRCYAKLSDEIGKRSTPRAISRESM